MEDDIIDQSSPEQEIEQEEIIIEKEWDRIEKLLAQKHQASLNMAIVEADKLFREVLGIISFGETVNEAIQNSANLFSNMKGLLEARKVYEDIVEVPGFFTDLKTAQEATAIYLRSILDMMGKDYREKSSWQVFINELVYFSESHPHLIRDIFLGILIFLIGVWFLSGTTWGQYLVGIAVGITQFILTWAWGFVIVLGAILVVVLVSWLFFERRKR
ncbi:MAG: hypothetical protein WC805_02235 [Patescibacteria group bacterium]|jgi:hypothetical protein